MAFTVFTFCSLEDTIYFRIARTARRQKHDIPVAAHPHETKKHYICRYFHTNLIQ